MNVHETTTDSGCADDDGALVGEPESTGALVEVLPRQLAAYGGIDLEALDGTEVLDVDAARVPDLTGLIAGSLTGVNLVAQGAQSALRARGLVRLAPETLQALRTTARPVVSGGWNLGTLASEGGRFAQSVRWLPATSAQAVTVLAGLGPVVAVVAISAQASALASTAARIESKIDALRAELEERDRADLTALLRDVCNTHEESLKCGFDSAETRNRINALVNRDDPGKMYQRYLNEAQKHQERSAQSAAALIDACGRIASDLGALVAVWRACDLIGVLGIGSLAAAGTEKKVLASRAQELQSDLYRREAEVTAVVASLQSRAHLLLVEEEIPGLAGEARKRLEGAVKGVSQRLSFGGRPDAPTLREVVAMIDEAIDSFDDARLAAPEPLIPEIQDGDADTAGNLCEALRWLLPTDEKVLALVEVDQGADHLVVTTCRWGLVTRRDLVTAKGLDSLSPLTDLRYVVDSGLKNSGQHVEIVTRERVVPVEFKRIKKGTDRGSTVERTLSLLRTAMNLPDDEREHDPLLSQPRPACAALPPKAV